MKKKNYNNPQKEQIKSNLHFHLQLNEDHHHQQEICIVAKVLACSRYIQHDKAIREQNQIS